MRAGYEELAEKYLHLARKVAEELQTDESVLGCAVQGSVARGEVHPRSDIDLLVLVKGSGIYRWERRVIEGIMVNIALRSQDVLERMAKEEPYTIWGLQEAQILYDPRGILQALKDEARLTPEVEREFLDDLLDEARSLIGKAERALAEGDLESALLWLRRGAMELAELIFYKEKGRRIRLIHFWQELQTLSSVEFRELFARIQGLQAPGRAELAEMFERLEPFLPKPGEP
ncbi:MAG: nucleotidyltransferase domain-containing protein [Candidatus Acetothermia bacterium]|nr:nucleotidyltransferase domain-containing protein [Candidatus Acetothermia bacterium]MDH7505177.1 nucleotidyltransferase domain-containing protein [Candidatus Acetothermia bacterium]